MKLTKTQMLNFSNILSEELNIDRKEALKRVKRLFDPIVKDKIQQMGVEFNSIVPIIDYVSLQPSDKELNLTVEIIKQFISNRSQK